MTSHFPAIASILLLIAGAATADEIDFNRDVRPILTKNCTTCHGGVKKAGDVSYLYREDVLGKGESGKVIAVPGKPGQSEMIARLTSHDPDDRMPPPDHHPKPLADQDIKILSDWILEGAKWGTHWAFEKPTMPDLPNLADSDWPRQDLDRFILAKLESEKLVPSPEASPAEWLRRTSFDLTGLPPTLEEWKTFQHDLLADPEAARVTATDHLLVSPAFGERWASVWLDLARYADSTGYFNDPHRDIWPYRNWVIEALNKGVPYDQFTIKQIAGDLLEHPEPGDLIATGFHRNTLTNGEGGTDDEEFRMAAMIDRVNTTWTAWNATTFGCVQCHSHPYDPIPHESYYEFLAIFNNSEDVDDHEIDYPVTKAATDPGMQAEALRLEMEIKQSRSQLNDRARDVAETLVDSMVFMAESAVAQPSTGKLTQNASGDFLSSGTNPNGALFKLTAEAHDFAAIRFDITPLNEDPAEWRELGAVVSLFEAEIIGTDGNRRPIRFREVIADYLAGPYDPNRSFDSDHAGFGAYPIMNGPRRFWIVPEQPIITGDGEKIELRIKHRATCNGANQSCVLRRFRIELSSDPALNEFVTSPERAKAWELHQSKVARYNNIDGLKIPVMAELPVRGARETRVFIRGNRMTLGDVVKPAVPAIFGGSKPVANRLDMARWLVSNDNPLAARVLANRLWANLFQVGIVETQEDFGSSGALPSHPELLDYLALRLRDHHRWQIKPMLKEIVLSASYRQSNKATPELISKDPDNRLIARGPRNRLTAEMVRDQALLVSGLLSHKLGGPPVYPPQPAGTWRTLDAEKEWKTSKAEDRYRRAIYTYVKRESSYPTFLTFDAPPRENCSARRIPTNTPLQALATLNDPAHIEFAQAFARRMQESKPDVRSQLAHGYECLALTEAPPEVIDTLESLFNDINADFAKHPAESVKLAPTPEAAAMVLVANTLLNSDIALNR